MITPTKRLASSKSLIFIGGQILDFIDQPKTISRLWNETQRSRQQIIEEEPITYSWFVLALDLLYILGAIEIRSGLVQRAQNDT